MIIDYFIGFGANTVPLQNGIERTENGKKTIPIFPKDWKNYYTKNKNIEKSTTAGLITGRVSGIVAIDCDNNLIWNIFRKLDEDYSVIIESIGKGGGTILYSYTENVDTFSVRNNEVQLDFFSNSGFIYLPTEDNKTKKSWERNFLLEIKPIPIPILSLLKLIGKKSVVLKKESLSNYGYRLAPILKKFVSQETSSKVEKLVYKVLTPKSFRTELNYVKFGHLLPKDIPKGSGSEYLSKVSAIVGSDQSVCKELYTEVMLKVNESFDEPMEEGRFVSTVLDPMLNEEASIENVPIWNYDKEWEKYSGFKFIAVNGDSIESFFDDVKGLYFIINYTTNSFKFYETKSTCLNVLKSLKGDYISEKGYDSSKHIIRTDVNPKLIFGSIPNSDKFNLFVRTTYLDIINSPEDYAHNSRYPEVIMNFLQTLIPEEKVLDFVLKFLKKKLSTFDYSPIVLYFIGVQGSGKDTFVNILSKIVGANYIARPSASEFLDKFNGWIESSYFVQLNEFGHALTSSREKNEALGIIKSVSGASEIQVRHMRQTGRVVKHFCTFIMTSNINPLIVETDDRRIAYINTPNKLNRAEWVKSFGGVSKVIERIYEEIPDFCYFLGNNVGDIDDDEYVEAPESVGKNEIILNSMVLEDKIAFFIQKEDFNSLEYLAYSTQNHGFTRGWNKGKIFLDELEKVINSSFGVQRNTEILKSKLKNIGLHIKYSTFEGKREAYYEVEQLLGYKLSYFNDSGFSDEGGEFNHNEFDIIM